MILNRFETFRDRKMRYRYCIHRCVQSLAHRRFVNDFCEPAQTKKRLTPPTPWHTFQHDGESPAPFSRTGFQTPSSAQSKWPDTPTACALWKDTHLTFCCLKSLGVGLARGSLDFLISLKPGSGAAAQQLLMQSWLLTRLQIDQGRARCSQQHS